MFSCCWGVGQEGRNARAVPGPWCRKLRRRCPLSALLDRLPCWCLQDCRPFCICFGAPARHCGLYLPMTVNRLPYDNRRLAVLAVATASVALPSSPTPCMPATWAAGKCVQPLSSQSACGCCAPCPHVPSSPERGGEGWGAAVSCVWCNLLVSTGAASQTGNPYNLSPWPSASPLLSAQAGRQQAGETRYCKGRQQQVLSAHHEDER